MDFQSIIQYEGKLVKLTLKNNFWYRAKLISVKEDCVEFVEERGKKLSVAPEFIVFLEVLG